MRLQSTPSVSPHGLGNCTAAVHAARPYQNQPASTPRHAEPSRNHAAEDDHHDDGLVHGHFWAMSSTIR